MMGMTPIKDAGRAAEYFGKSDGGYYLEGHDLRREWGGKDAARLGLTGTPELEQLHRLLHGLDPHTGKQLTAMLTEDRLAGWDFTASLPKGVTTALEGGDIRIQKALYAAGDEAMAEVQRLAMTRVRKGGKDADRLTASMLWLVREHPDTRPAKEDGKPDWDRHLHYIVSNATWDDTEKRWKALKVRDIFELRKFFSHSFDLRMSAKVAGLGYDIETKYKPDGKGGKRYATWDIKAAPGHETAWTSINGKNSRRRQEIEETAQEIVAARKERDADAPDTLSPLAWGKLGATTRQHKREDMTLDELHRYWGSRITPEERQAIDATIERARAGDNPAPQPLAAQAMAYAIAHKFQRSSVVEYRELLTTAMEKAMGGALPADFDREAQRQGVLFDGGQVAPRTEVSTQGVLDQEQRVIGFARDGKGKFSPLAPDTADGLAGLSAEQRAAVRHVWQSTDRLMLIRGAPGAGKTTMMKPALAHLGVPAVLLAPSSDASRGELRNAGFADANTVASFLGDQKMQASAQRGIIWVDEASLLPMDDLDKLCALASSLEARIVLQGDPSQHKAVNRHGNMLHVLEEYAGLPVAELKEIQRQKGDYAKAVEAIRAGDVTQGDALLRKLGWVVEGQGHDALVAEYAKAIEETKPDGSRKTVLVVDPTHKDGDALTEKLRAVRKEKGLVGQQDKTFGRLVPLHWTDAEKADARHYAGDEVVQFFRNCGKFKAGDRVKASDLVGHLAKLKPSHFAVFSGTDVHFAVGDTVRTTNGGWDVTGKHRIDNGRIDTIKGFTKGGDIVLANGWVLDKDFAHLKHGLVSTSPASQSKTEDIVLGAFNKASQGAMALEQFLVTVSRGRERGMVFTDLPREELLEAVARQDKRKSATELLHKQHPAAELAEKAESRMRQFMNRVRDTYRQWQHRAAQAVLEPFRQREAGYAR